MNEMEIKHQLKCPECGRQSDQVNPEVKFSMLENERHYLLRWTCPWCDCLVGTFEEKKGEGDK